MRRIRTLFLVAAFGLSALGSFAAADDWSDYKLGEFYPLDKVSDRTVINAADAVVYTGNATGFIISPDGYILTNHHVYLSIGDTATVRRRWSGRFYAEKLKIKLVLKSKKYDVALYKAEGATNLPYIPLRTDSKVGEGVFILGHPKGKSLRASFGKILAKKLVIAGRPSIEYSAQTWWGSSGSPILDRKGRAVAIHWGWDSKGISNGRLTGVPFELIVKAIPKIGEVAGKKRVAAAVKAKFEVRTTLIARGESRDTIKVAIAADKPAALRKIKSVTYHLHPSFHKPVVKGNAHKLGSPLRLRCYGFFKVKAVIEFDDGKTEIVEGMVRWDR